MAAAKDELDPVEDEPSTCLRYVTDVISRCDDLLPTFVDMLTDDVRIRLITPVIFLLIYYMLATIYTGRRP